MKKDAVAYYAAGGAVRDLLLGRACHDMDFAFAGPERDFIQRNPSARKIQKGKSVLYLLHGQEFSPLPLQERTASPDFEQDILRRDFTINALLLSKEGVLRAHPLAYADLRNRIIRPVSASSLEDDPVRVFRAARFSAQFPDFILHEDSIAQMRRLGPGNALAAIAAEQVGNETRKACSTARPGNFLRALNTAGCLFPWFSEFASGGHLPAGPFPYHRSSVLEHSADVMDKAARHAGPLAGTERELAVWMALCHDLGKTATPSESLPQHHGHEEKGRGLARNLGKRLRLPSLFIKAGELASLLHMKAARYRSLRPGTKADLLMTLHAAHLEQAFFVLAAADSKQDTLPALMRRDLELLLGVKLPPQWRNQGKQSGERLRLLRCEALSRQPGE